MASYVSSYVFCFGVLCLLCCFNFTQGELALDCCLDVSDVRIPKRIVKSYEKQFQGQGCDINAVVFTSKRNVKLCAPAEAEWVKALMADVDSKLKWCVQKSFKPKRCHGLRG